MSKKYYLECGEFQKVMIANDPMEASELFMKFVLAELKSGNTKTGIQKEVLISEAGFREDLEKWGSSTQKLETVRMYAPAILREIGEDWLANDMQKWIENENDKNH